VHLGEHFLTLQNRLIAAGFEEDWMPIVNNYAVGVQQALDHMECPRCHDFLERRKDRLLSTKDEIWWKYLCHACGLELDRPDFRIPWWKRLFATRT